MVCLYTHWGAPLKELNTARILILLISSPHFLHEDPIALSNTSDRVHVVMTQRSVLILEPSYRCQRRKPFASRHAAYVDDPVYYAAHAHRVSRLVQNTQTVIGCKKT